MKNNNACNDNIAVDISIIVPVYNGQDYLSRCLESIFNQRFSGTFEVIAVEDCSTDNSLEVLKGYKQTRTELIVLEHKTNKRLSAVRSTGMKAAQGEYVMHVDQDDWLLPNALEKLYAKCKETDADVIVYDYFIKSNQGVRTHPNKIKREIITTDKDKVHHLFFGSCWTKIVKRSLTEDMIYSSTKSTNSAEDLIYCTEILLRAEKICLFPQNLYTYFKNEASMTNSIKPFNYLNNQVIILNNLNEVCLRYNPDTLFESRLMDYFERWIYLAICKLHFWNNKDLKVAEELFEEVFQIPLLNTYRANELRKSLDNKYLSLFYVAKCFGLRLSLGIVYRGIKN